MDSGWAPWCPEAGPLKLLEFQVGPVGPVEPAWSLGRCRRPTWGLRVGARAFPWAVDLPGAHVISTWEPT